MGTTERYDTHDDLDSLSAAAAELVSAASSAAIQDRGRFVLALAGGSTPRRLYALLADRPWRDQIDWARWHVFLGDERVVPADDPQSNFRMAQESLLDRAPIPRAHIHRARTELGDPERAAADYERQIREFFRVAAPDIPRFDLVLLGIGSDGHTASLFPGKPALDEASRLVVATEPGRLPPSVDRITFTFPLINASRTVCFLVAGADKAPALQSVRENAGADSAPAARVRPTQGAMHWLIDAAATGGSRG